VRLWGTALIIIIIIIIMSINVILDNKSRVNMHLSTGLASFFSCSNAALMLLKR
jgi:hypothetical protein